MDSVGYRSRSWRRLAAPEEESHGHTGRGFDTQNPSAATRLDLMQVSFNTAGERAWGIGGNIDFGGLGVPGLTASAIYADGRDRIDDPNGGPLPNHNETDVRVDYAIGKASRGCRPRSAIPGCVRMACRRPRSCARTSIARSGSNRGSLA